MRMRLARRSRVLVPALLLTAGSVTGCGLLQDMTAPDAAVAEPAVTAAPVSPSPAPARDRVVASAVIGDDRGFPGPFDGTVTVTVQPIVPGLPDDLGGTFRADCGFDTAGDPRYAAVDITFENRSRSVASLAATLSAVDTPQAGDRTGDFGLFIRSSSGGRYCQDGDRTPRADHFDVANSAGGEVTVTAYLVSDASLRPDGATPEDAFTDLTLQLTGLRNTAYSAPELVTVGDWAVRGFSVAGPCTDEPDSICAPLG
jgi:hypothetical protein